LGGGGENFSIPLTVHGYDAVSIISTVVKVVVLKRCGFVGSDNGGVKSSAFTFTKCGSIRYLKY